MNEENVSLKNRKKLPNELKQTRNKILFKNLWIAILITLYFLFINLGSINIERSVFIVDLKVFSLAILVLAIILFEKGYQQDNEWLFLNGVEALMVALITLFMPYMFWKPTMTLELFFYLSFLYFIVYYFIKSLVQAKKIKKKYMHSDAREIVKK